MNALKVLAPVAVLAVVAGTPVGSLAAAPSCDLTFRITASGGFSSASVFAIYQNAPGEFAGEGANVECQILNGLIGNAGDADMTRTLTLTVVGTPTPVQGPVDIARCKWTPTSRFPVTGDFNLSAQSGFDTNFPVPNMKAANIVISDIDCDGSITTTTSSTTTTTTLETTTTTSMPATTTTSTSTSTSTTTTTLPDLTCGDITGNGTVSVTDALAVLRAAVMIVTCDLCRCDIDGDGEIAAADALRLLRFAVGLEVAFSCPTCDED